MALIKVGSKLTAAAASLSDSWKFPSKKKGVKLVVGLLVQCVLREFLSVILMFWVIVVVVHESSHEIFWRALVGGDEGEVKLWLRLKMWITEPSEK